MEQGARQQGTEVRGRRSDVKGQNRSGDELLFFLADL